jgi:hypothetical protein
MTLRDALDFVHHGQDVSRTAWHNVERRLTSARLDGKWAARLEGPAPLNDDDLEADDWFVVGPPN